MEVCDGWSFEVDNRLQSWTECTWSVGSDFSPVLLTYFHVSAGIFKYFYINILLEACLMMWHNNMNGNFVGLEHLNWWFNQTNGSVLESTQYFLTVTLIMKLVYLVAGALKCIKTTEEDQNGFLHLKTLNYSECNCSKLLAVIFPFIMLHRYCDAFPALGYCLTKKVGDRFTRSGNQVLSSVNWPCLNPLTQERRQGFQFNWMFHVSYVQANTTRKDIKGETRVSAFLNMTHWAD